MINSYPASLPGPDQWTIKRTDARASSSLRDPSAELRARSRDKNSTASAQWMYTSAQMAVWKDWFKTNLVLGQAWFVATVPGPGAAQKVIRYVLSTLRRQNLGNGVFLVSCDVEVRGLATTALYQDLNLDGRTNAGTSSAVGVTISGLDPSHVYTLSLPPGLTYPGGYRTDVPVHPNDWTSRFRYTTSGGTVTFETSSNGYPSAEASRASFATDYPGASITGYSSYTFWIYDTPNSDNDGGLSIRISY